jgi:peptide/nickel transport system permease protein
MATTSTAAPNAGNTDNTRGSGGAPGLPTKPGGAVLAAAPARRRGIPVLSSSALRATSIRVGLGIVGFFVLLAFVGPVIFQQDPMAFGPDKLVGPSAAHWLGTTQTGQDVFSQVIDGARPTLLLGALVGVLATTLSVVVGLTAAFFGGFVDEILSALTNIFLVIPALPLAIVMAGYLPVKGPIPIAIVITITGWAWGARVLRAQTLSLRRRDFVEAARAGGEHPLRIMFFEILPNEIAIVMSSLIFTTIFAILAEVGLEFIGLGDITQDSWGSMLFWSGNSDALLVGAWWWIVPPGLCIALLGAGLALTNFGIDEITNPRLRGARIERRRRR